MEAQYQHKIMAEVERYQQLMEEKEVRSRVKQSMKIRENEY